MIRRIALVALVAACVVLVWLFTLVLDRSAAATSAVFPARTA